MRTQPKLSSIRRKRPISRDYGEEDHKQVKGRLGREIAGVIRASGLAQLSAADALGIDQPKISRLMRGQLDKFSTALLLRFLALLGGDVEIMVRPPTIPHPSHLGRFRVADGGKAQ